MSTELKDELEKSLINLNDQKLDELLDIIGAYALSEEPGALRDTLAIDRGLDTKQLKKAAQNFLKKLEPVTKEAICGSDGLLSYMDQPTLKEILMVIITSLGYQIGGMIPTAIMAISVIIFRAGVREYCKNGYPLIE
jgi:hypothetical protein